MSAHFFGVRHHGPGSARSLVRALKELEPDALLIEGPPDAEELLPYALHADIEPPVALLVYVPLAHYFISSGKHTRAAAVTSSLLEQQGAHP